MTDATNEAEASQMREGLSLHKHVVVRVLKTMGNVLLEGLKDSIDLNTGDIWILPFAAVRKLLLDGAAECC